MDNIQGSKEMNLLFCPCCGNEFEDTRAEGDTSGRICAACDAYEQEYYLIHSK